MIDPWVVIGAYALILLGIPLLTAGSPYFCWRVAPWFWRRLPGGRGRDDLSRRKRAAFALVLWIACVALYGLAFVVLESAGSSVFGMVLGLGLLVPLVVATPVGALLLLWVLLKRAIRLGLGAWRRLGRALRALPGLATSPQFWGGVRGAALAGVLALVALLPVAVVLGFGGGLDELRRERLAMVGARVVGSPFGRLTAGEVERARAWARDRTPSAVGDLVTSFAAALGSTPAEWGVPTPDGAVREAAGRQAARRVYVDAVARRLEQRFREEVGDDEAVDVLLLVDAWRLQQERVDPALLWTVPRLSGPGSREAAALLEESRSAPGRIFLDRGLLAEARRSVQGMADDPQMWAFLWAVGGAGMEVPPLHPPPPFTMPVALPGALRREAWDALRADTAATGPILPAWLEELTGISVPSDEMDRRQLLEAYEEIMDDIASLYDEVEVVPYDAEALVEALRAHHDPPSGYRASAPTFVEATTEPFLTEILGEVGDSAALSRTRTTVLAVAPEERLLAAALEAALDAGTAADRSRAIGNARDILDALRVKVETYAESIDGPGGLYLLLVDSFEETLDELEVRSLPQPDRAQPVAPQVSERLRRMGTAGGSGGRPFVDTCDRITEIRVRGGWWIDALQVVCAGSGPQPLRGAEGGNLYTFTLRPGEEVVAVSGFALGPVPAVYGIRFHTSQRTSDLFGNGGDSPSQRGRQPFRFDVPEDARLVGFHGAASGHLDRFGLVVAPAGSGSGAAPVVVPPARTGSGDAGSYEGAGAEVSQAGPGVHEVVLGAGGGGLSLSQVRVIASPGDRVVFGAPGGEEWQVSFAEASPFSTTAIEGTGGQSRTVPVLPSARGQYVYTATVTLRGVSLATQGEIVVR